MNVFQRVERALQRSVERPFTKLARSTLQPVEVARALGRELVANRRVGIGRVYAPNWFHAELATTDFRQFEPFLLQLEGEIAQDLLRQARRRRYEFVGDVTVELLANATLRRGDILATAEIREASPTSGPEAGGAAVIRTSVIPIVAPPPAVENQRGDALTLIVRDERGVERRSLFTAEAVTIGRGLNNDLILDSLSVSRDHARLTQDDGWVIEDVGSRNGVAVNGQRVQRARLQAGDRIRLGAVELLVEP